jgi:hypothetical protein
MSRQDDDDIGLRDPYETDDWAMVDPPDHPLGVTDTRVTAAGERVDEPISRRVRREVPDGVSGGGVDDRVGVLVDPMADEPLDVEPDLVALEGDVDDPIGLSAEEAAMHLAPDPPMGDGDGYLEDDA